MVTYNERFKPCVLHVTSDLYAHASGLGAKNRTRLRLMLYVLTGTNLMLHSDPWFNYYMYNWPCVGTSGTLLLIVQWLPNLSVVNSNFQCSKEELVVGMI